MSFFTTGLKGSAALAKLNEFYDYITGKTADAAASADSASASAATAASYNYPSLHEVDGRLMNGTTSPVGQLTIFKIVPNDSADNAIAIVRFGTTYGSAIFHNYNSEFDKEALNLAVSDGTGTPANNALTKYRITSDGNHVWYGATTATKHASIDASGNLLVGVTSGSAHILHKDVSEGNAVAAFEGASGGAFVVYSSDGGDFSTAASATVFRKNSTTGRSINAGGTINASGADYAEYMTKSDTCGVIAKGQIVGVNTEGKLTDKWAEIASGCLFKTTNPSYVGGDVWGSEEELGMTRPVAPIRKVDVTEQRLVSEAVPEVKDEEGNITQAAQEAVYETVILEPGDTDEEWTAKQSAYQSELQAFNDALEAARQKVDRIAFSGQVPVNVLGAVPGQYIVPVQDGEGIGGILVNKADLTLQQYIEAVGVVQNILPDGRANVRVKVA